MYTSNSHGNMKKMRERTHMRCILYHI